MSSSTYRKPCWIDQIDCTELESECRECGRFFLKFAKIVYCSKEECLWRKEVPFETEVRTAGQGKRFFEDSGKYNGVCSRNEIAINSREIRTNLADYSLAECPFATQKTSPNVNMANFPKW